MQQPISFLKQRIGRHNARLLFVALSVLGVLSVGVQTTASAHVASPNGFFDFLIHASGDLGEGEAKRDWADTPYCRTEVVRMDIADGPGGVKRTVYKFKTIGDINGRGHALEAGAFADSISGHCIDDNGSAWNGQRVNLNDSMFDRGGRPSRVTVGVTNSQEDALNAVGGRVEVPSFGYDGFVKLRDGIGTTTNGGAYGWNGDASGFKVNGTTVWCAGLDLPAISGNIFGYPTNIRWPGSFDNDCAGSGDSYLFREGDNYNTGWGAFAIGSMQTGWNPSIDAVRCDCALGSPIPGGIAGDGTFGLTVAGIKTHDGVGTYNTNPTENPFGIPGYIDDLAQGRGTPYPIAIGEAWLVMEWDPASEPEAPEVSCEIQTSIQFPEVGQDFDIELTYNYKGPANQLEWEVELTGGPAAPGMFPSGIQGPINVPNTNGAWTTGDRLITNNYSADAGSYTYEAYVRVRGRPNIRRSCDGGILVVQKPYFKVWSNDVQIGGNFADNTGACIPKEGNATIIGYGGDGSSHVFSGASAEYAVAALGEIRNFFSAGRRSDRGDAEPTPPHGLTFANAQIDGIVATNPLPGDTNKVVNYGGMSGISHCARNWLATEPSSSVSTAASPIAGGGSGATTSTLPSGTLRISGGALTGQRSIFVPDPDVTVVINGDITSADNSGAKVFIIAAGDIKIAANVRQLNAVLITGRTLYTCTKSGGSPWASNELFASCGGDVDSGKLVITGAVVADRIKFQRTFGSRLQSNKNEGAIFNAAAEEIIFDPTLFTTKPALDLPPNAKATIDFMTSLPPVL